MKTRKAFVRYTLSVTREGVSGIIVVSVVDVNEPPEFSKEDDKLVADSTNGAIELFVLESSAIDTAVSIGIDSGGQPNPEVAQFVATDQDAAVPAWQNVAYELLYDANPDDNNNELKDVYDGPDALVSVTADGTIVVASMLDTDEEDSVTEARLRVRAYDPTEVADEDGNFKLQDYLEIHVEVVDTNVAPVFDTVSK